MDKDVAEVLDWMDRWASGELMSVAKLQQRLPSYPFDAKDVPDDYVLRGDGLWVPQPVTP